MKYTKSIVGFMTLNLILIFLMIFVANKSRELEKNNNFLEREIVKIKENIKINKIEYSLHLNISYLKTLYSLYLPEIKISNQPKITTMKELDNSNIRLVKTTTD